MLSESIGSYSLIINNSLINHKKKEKSQMGKILMSDPYAAIEV